MFPCSLQMRLPALALGVVLVTSAPYARADDRLIEPTFAAVYFARSHASMPVGRFQHPLVRTRNALTPPGRHAMTARSSAPWVG
jgi:hypothetical protein